MSLSEFLHMGGYGVYVWTSYALALVLLLVNLIVPLHQHRKLKEQLARRLRRGGQVNESGS